MYDCKDGKCGLIHNWKCERRCADIESPGKNVILMSGKSIEYCKVVEKVLAFEKL